MSFFLPFTQSFKRSGRLFPIFRNLTHLKIGNILRRDLGLILGLLERTPRLEVLVLGNCGFSTEDCTISSQNIYFWSAHVPACISLNLKVVSFEGFLMLENEFKLVEYFLENAKALDELKIQSKGNLEKQFEMNMKLLTFTRWSRACRIAIDPVIE